MAISCRINRQRDGSVKPLEINKGSLGPVEWSGTGLDAVSSATLYKPAAPEVPGQPGPTPPAGTPADWVTYDKGEKIIVSFREGSTEFLGKAEVEFQTPTGDSIRVPLFVKKEVR
jgi:hypothetical protein